MGRESTPLDLITNVWPPEDKVSLDIGSSSQRWGPFDVGTMVRVASAVNAWCIAGDSQIVAVANRGAPIGAWTHSDYQIQDEDHRYIAMIIDSGSSGFATVQITGRLETVAMADTREAILSEPVRQLTQAVSTLNRSIGGRITDNHLGNTGGSGLNTAGGRITQNHGGRSTGGLPIPTLSNPDPTGTGLVPGCD